jgi:hypothetical protein
MCVTAGLGVLVARTIVVVVDVSKIAKKIKIMTNKTNNPKKIRDRIV